MLESYFGRGVFLCFFFRVFFGFLLVKRLIAGFFVRAFHNHALRFEQNENGKTDEQKRGVYNQDSVPLKFDRDE